MNSTAADLEAAFQGALGDGRDPVRFVRWLADIWAEDVMITHTPPFANDGPAKGRELGAGEVAVFSALVAAIPDYRQENFWVKADGDRLEFYEEIVGTLPDGSVHRAPIHYIFTIEDGRIAKVHGTFERAALAPFSEVVAKAGQRTPG